MTHEATIRLLCQAVAWARGKLRGKHKNQPAGFAEWLAGIAREEERKAAAAQAAIDAVRRGNR